MPPRRPDPLKPPAGKSYSKEQVNRAGRLLAEWHEKPWDPSDEHRFDPWGLEAIVAAYQAEAFSVLDRGEELSLKLKADINERYQQVRGRLKRKPPSSPT